MKDLAARARGVADELERRAHNAGGGGTDLERETISYIRDVATALGEIQEYSQGFSGRLEAAGGTPCFAGTPCFEEDQETCDRFYAEEATLADDVISHVAHLLS